jgi:hypothetical protein
MRKQFVEGSIREAKKVCPWAHWFADADGGVWCFEARNDYLVWMRTK